MQANRAGLKVDANEVDVFDKDHPSYRDPFFAARALSTPVWVFDIDEGRILFANPRACEMWQADDEAELVSRDMGRDMSTTVAKRLKQYQADFIQGEVTFREMWTLYPNGRPISSSVAFRGFPLPDGRMAMQCEVLAEAEDTPDNIRSAEALLHTDVMIALFELNGGVLYANPAARNVMDGLAQTLSTFFVDPSDYHVLMFDLDGKGEHHMVAKVATKPEPSWFDISAKLCNDAVTGETAVLVTAIDVSELKTARDKARHLADRDQLTGCFNRAYLQRHIEGLPQFKSFRYGLLFFDVDRFKHVNDTFGHEAGDDVLRALAQWSEAATRPEELVVRLGGDEFAVLLRFDLEEDIETRVQAIFERLCGTVTSGAARIETCVSMGVTEFLPAETDFEGLLRQADIALYHSKRKGRGRYTIYDEDMGKAALEQIKFEKEIEHGLAQRQFVLFYQPRVDVTSGEIVSVEGLVRWNHPERGLVPPNLFIPICEETGMIEILGQHVLEMGFKQSLIWQEQGRDLGISLNISPRQFADTALMEMLTLYAEMPDFQTDKIELELTENVLIGDLEAIADKLRAISELGYKIAIDDFGTGYSNLSYISRFRLSCLKIDQSFINQLPEAGPIVTLILALGKQIGATVVAEGVETQHQYDWLAAQGCNQIQGYHISRPLPLEDLEAML